MMMICTSCYLCICIILTWGSGPLLCMAGYSSLCELFFIMSKFDFDRVDPLEPNFLVLDNIDLSHFIKSFPENINFANTIFNCLMPEECTLFQIGKLDSHHSIMGSMIPQTCKWE